MKATVDDFGSRYLIVYLDGERLERCLFADDEKGLAEQLEPGSATNRRTRFRHGKVEFRLYHGTPPVVQEALERRYGRPLEREEP